VNKRNILCRKKNILSITKAAAVRHRDFLNKNYNETYYIQYVDIHIRCKGEGAKEDILVLNNFLKIAKGEVKNMI
jgi:hypothetical protein